LVTASAQIVSYSRFFPVRLVVIGLAGEVLVVPVRRVDEVGPPRAGVAAEFLVGAQARQSM